MRKRNSTPKPGTMAYIDTRTFVERLASHRGAALAVLAAIALLALACILSAAADKQALHLPSEHSQPSSLC